MLIVVVVVVVVVIVVVIDEIIIFPFSPFDIVGWITGRASGLYNVGCWFVDGDDLTGALHDL